jgi:anti-repressor protein
MEEIIKITEKDGRRAVSARELHQFLENKRKFADWIKQRIEQYGFTENQDYEVFHNSVNNSEGGRPQIEYALSVDMAKELSMVENNEKGKQARKYFIECEKLARNTILPSYQIEDPIARAERWIEEQKERKALEAKNAAMQPKAEYFDNLVEKGLLTNFRDTAKEIGLKQNQFINILQEKKYVYRDGKGQLKPYAQYAGDLFELKDWGNAYTAGQRTLITPKGKETFRLLFGTKK